VLNIQFSVVRMWRGMNFARFATGSFLSAVWEPVEKLQQFILRRGGRADFVAPPLQITADMLGRRASSSYPPRSQSEPP
jgi:hypothetical protein